MASFEEKIQTPSKTIVILSPLICRKYMNYRTTLVSVVLAIHCVMLAYSAARHSPTFNEIGHLPAGLSHLKHGSFELYRVNPPMPRMVSAISLYFQEYNVNWIHHNNSPTGRSEILVGIDFAEANGEHVFELYTWGRWFVIPFTLLGGLCCFLWANELFGWLAGFFALLLWCFSPSILGHGALIMPDVPSAATGLASSYSFWHWLRSPTWPKTITAGLLLGIAELTKFTLLIFYVIYPLLWIIQIAHERSAEKMIICKQSLKLLFIFFISVYVINFGYGFRGSFTPIGNYTFVSSVLSGANSGDTPQPGNVFRGSEIHSVMLPFPIDYIQGLDRQKADFDSDSWSYMNGKWKLGGWHCFYLLAFLIKTPIGLIAIYSMTVIAIMRKRSYRSDLVTELCIALPVVSIGLLISSQTAFSIHPRYALPILPFLFVWTSRITRSIQFDELWTSIISLFLFAWFLLSSLMIFPHSLSYFNEFVGGPKNGSKYLIDSAIAWGQDIIYLKEWCEIHPEARPLRIASFGWIDPQIAGIEYSLPPLGLCDPRGSDNKTSDAIGPLPGWYIIDVNHLRGTFWDAPTGNGKWRHFLSEFEQKREDFSYFSEFEPVDHIAYSYFVYNISLDQANRYRVRWGLPTVESAGIP